jgi:hypothetical protein
MRMIMTTQRLCIVFEATNRTLHESFIATSSLPLDIVRLRHQKTPPAAIAHWQPSEDVSYTIVGSGLSLQDAPAFLKGYGQTAVQFGWKVITDNWQ